MEVWFDFDRVRAMPDDEKNYFNYSTVMHQMGNGINHLMPGIVSPDSASI